MQAVHQRHGGTIDTGCKDEDKLHGLSRYEGNSIIWFDTSENRKRKQKKTKGNSFMNEEEKRIILDILEDLKKSNELDNQDIGIITGYSGQKDILRNSVKAIGYDKIAQIDINVLDAFQGRENDIIMYSTVRTGNSIGFQKEKERVNVAFSRAKKLLIICGDLNFFYNYNDPNNKFIEIIDYIRTHDHCKIISCKELLEMYKDYIIEQINNKKVLKNHFKYRRINQQGYEGEILEERSDLYDELKKIHFTKNKKSIDYTLITDEVFNDRKLMDGEYRDILKYIVSQSSDVDLYVDNLDDWAFDSQFTATLTENMGKSNLSVYYAQSNNIKAAKKQIEWNFKGECKCVENDKKYFFCWKTESYLLYGVPKLRNVIDDNTMCLCMSYYLHTNS